MILVCIFIDLLQLIRKTFKIAAILFMSLRQLQIIKVILTGMKKVKSFVSML